MENIDELVARVHLDDDKENKPTSRPVIDIEIRFQKSKNSGIANIADLVKELSLAIRGLDVYNAKSIRMDGMSLANIDRVVFSCSEMPDGQKLSLQDLDMELARVHAYSTRNYGAMPQDLTLGADGGAGADTAVGSHHYEMPCVEFDDLWETLVFDDNIKNDLLNYAFALLRLSEMGISSTVLAINRIILLHGPPGTGKTSLCKALAQRLSIRIGQRFKRCLFVEINSHSLFSKWFSESGKLIGKLFDDIEDLALDEKQLVFVLIDEVESLTMGRNAAFSGADPSDSVRAVNAVLTQLDKLKKYNNILIFATSNLTDALDSAFLDRTDICRMVSNPAPTAIYKIISSTIGEFLRVGALDGEITTGFGPMDELVNISKMCENRSGRSIRKLAAVAYSKLNTAKPNVCQFLRAMQLVLRDSKMQF